MKLAEKEMENHRAAQWAGRKIAGRREASAFSRKHGKSNTFLYDIMRSKDPSLSRLQALADWLGMTVGEMIEEAKVADEEDEEDKLHFSSKSTEYCVVDGLTVGLVEISPELQVIDDLRYENPVAALERLSRKEPEPDQLPYFFAVSASCNRMILEFGCAAYLAGCAERLAESQDNSLALGTALQRWVYICSDVSHFQSAYSRNKRSREAFLEAGASRRIAESIIDSGFCLYKLKKYTEAIAALETTIRYNDMLSLRNKIVRLKTKSACLLSQGEQKKALRACHEALLMAKDGGKAIDVAKTMWLTGLIEGKSGNLAVAQELVVNAAHALLPINPADALVALLELASLMIAVGKNSLAADILEVELPEFASEIAKFPPVENALQELFATLFLRRLNEEALRETIRAIKESRPNVFKRLLA